MVSSATSIGPYKGILGILLIIMRLGPADATTGFDCDSKQNKNVTTIPFKDLTTNTTSLHRSKLFGSQHPEEYAYLLMGSGYTTIPGEDKFYIMQCPPVEVKLQPQDKCYDRLPIVKGNQKMFLAPWTLVITNHANEIPCDSPILQDYGLDGIWYKALPKPAETSDQDQGIKKLKPSTKLTWEYVTIKNLANGIYTEEEFRSAWEFKNNPKQFNPPPSEVATYPEANGNVPGVIYLNRGQPLWYNSWNTYSVLVVVAVGIVVILLVVCIVKMAADRINHGSALHSIRNRQRIRQTESNQADLTIRLDKAPDV